MGGIPVLVASDSSLLRGALQRDLALCPDIQMVAGIEVADLSASCMELYRPAVVVLDVARMSDKTLERVLTLMQAPNAPALIAVGDPVDLPVVLRLLRMGAAGYVHADEVSTALPRAIVCATQGQAFLCPGASSVLLSEIRRQPRRRTRPAV